MGGGGGGGYNSTSRLFRFMEGTCLRARTGYRDLGFGVTLLRWSLDEVCMRLVNPDTCSTMIHPNPATWVRNVGKEEH